MKGKLANSVAFNVRVSNKNQGDRALFVSNSFDGTGTNTHGYAYGNSFGIVYDDLNTLSIFGELKADFSKNVTFGIGGTFSDYKGNSQQEVWNLPTVEVNSTLDFNITPKWFAGAKVFYVGERKDMQLNPNVVYVVQPGPTTLKSYFDVNAHLGYKHNSQITGFLKLNNISNNSYQKWMNYPVQGFQVLVGANFKFDF